MKVVGFKCFYLLKILFYRDTLDSMDNIAEQVIKDISDYLSENEKPPLPASAASALKSQILEIKNPEHKIRALISKY